MKRPLFLPAVIAVLFLSSCTKDEVKTPVVVNTPAQSSGTPEAASKQPKDGNYPGEGKVTKINMDLGSVELDHKEIVGVMPPMIMEFYVKDKSILKGLAVGDQVNFVLEYKHPSETIVEIKKK